MSHPAQHTSFSRPARLLCYLGPPSAILLTSVASPKTGLLSPLAFLHTAWFFKQWRESNKMDPSPRAELEPLVWTYATTGTVGLVAAGLIQLVTAFTASFLLFGLGETRSEFLTEFQRSTIAGLTADELARRAELAGCWQNWIFNIALTFGMAGLVEETLKYLPIAYARRRATVEQRQSRNRAYLDYAVAGALGFGLVENIAFLYTSCEIGHETWPQLVLSFFERTLLGSLGHLLVASLTALRAIRRDCYGDQLSWWAVVGPAVILHGTYNFVAMAFSAIEGNVGWLHPTGVGNTTSMVGLCFGVIATAAWLVKREWKELEDRERQRK